MLNSVILILMASILAVGFGVLEGSPNSHTDLRLFSAGFGLWASLTLATMGVLQWSIELAKPNVGIESIILANIVFVAIPYFLAAVPAVYKKKMREAREASTNVN